MVVTAPVIDLLRGTPTHEDRPYACISSNNSPTGPGGREKSPNHSCSRSKPSPPGFSGSSFGPAIYPSRGIDM